MKIFDSNFASVLSPIVFSRMIINFNIFSFYIQTKFKFGSVKKSDAFFVGRFGKIPSAEENVPELIF